MSYSEEYKRLKKEWAEKPDYLKETYNVNFATSKHAKKLSLGKNKDSCCDCEFTYDDGECDDCKLAK